MFSYNFMLLFVPAIIECFPANLEPETLKSDARDETTYPNGTVVGKYSYVDTDGTPVQVKYYADDKNYGVELQSVKVVEGTEQPAQFSKQPKIDYLRGEASDSSSMPAEPDTTNNIGFDFPTTFPKPEDKYKLPAIFLSMNKNSDKNHCKEGKTSDYDFSRNDLMPFKNKKCGKERLRLFYDKRSRRARKTADTYNSEMPKICDQF